MPFDDREQGTRPLSPTHHTAPETLVIDIALRHTLELERQVRQLGVLYYTEKPPEPVVIERIASTIFAPQRRAVHP